MARKRIGSIFWIHGDLLSKELRREPDPRAVWLCTVCDAGERANSPHFRGSDAVERWENGKKTRRRLGSDSAYRNLFEGPSDDDIPADSEEFTVVFEGSRGTTKDSGHASLEEAMSAVYEIYYEEQTPVEWDCHIESSRGGSASATDLRKMLDLAWKHLSRSPLRATKDLEMLASACEELNALRARLELIEDLALAGSILDLSEEDRSNFEAVGLHFFCRGLIEARRERNALREQIDLLADVEATPAELNVALGITPGAIVVQTREEFNEKLPPDPAPTLVSTAGKAKQGSQSRSINKKRKKISTKLRGW